MVIESPKSDGKKRNRHWCRYYQNKNCVVTLTKCAGSAHCPHYDDTKTGVPIVLVPKSKIPPQPPKEPDPFESLKAKKSDMQKSALETAIRTPGAVLKFYLGGTVTVIDYDAKSVLLRKENGTETWFGIEYCIKKRLVFL